MKKAKAIFSWMFIAITLILNGLFAFICLFEWYKIGIQGKEKEYPFGGEGPVPYYYKTEELYVLVNQIWGLILFANLIFLIWTLKKGNKKTKIFAVTITWTFLILEVWQGLIGVI